MKETFFWIIFAGFPVIGLIVGWKVSDYVHKSAVDEYIMSPWELLKRKFGTAIAGAVIFWIVSFFVLNAFHLTKSSNETTKNEAVVAAADSASPAPAGNQVASTVQRLPEQNNNQNAQVDSKIESAVDSISSSKSLPDASSLLKLVGEDKISAVFPDWKNLINSREFSNWKATQPTEINDLYYSKNPEDMIKLITLYKQNH